MFTASRLLKEGSEDQVEFRILNIIVVRTTAAVDSRSERRAWGGVKLGYVWEPGTYRTKNCTSVRRELEPKDEIRP